jgi:hypothetical protein
MAVGSLSVLTSGLGDHPEAIPPVMQIGDSGREALHKLVVLPFAAGADALINPYQFSRFGIMGGLPATAQCPPTDLNSANFVWAAGGPKPSGFRYRELNPLPARSCSFGHMTDGQSYRCSLPACRQFRLSVHKRSWKNAKGEIQEARTVDYVDQKGKRHIDQGGGPAGDSPGRQ